MSKKIEIHYVVELTNNSINRGRNGELKKTVDAFGNTYQYISRQCVNRNVREKKMMEEGNRQGKKVTRKEFLEMVDAELNNAGLTDAKKIEEIREAILDVYGCGGKKEKANGKATKADEATENAEKKEESKVDNLIVFLSDGEIAGIVDALNKIGWDKVDKKTVGKTIETCRNELPMSRDVALFGRMVASNPILNVRGALAGSDLIGVTKCTPVNDFFTSKTDTEDENAGATNLGDIEMASTIFYGCTVIDVDTLKKNLKEDSETEAILSWKYLKDFVENFGKGREHSKFNRTYPFYIAVGVTEGNAFAIGHHVMANKNSVEEIAEAMHNSLANNPNRIADGFKFVEMDETKGKYDDFKQFIKENSLDA